METLVGMFEVINVEKFLQSSTVGLPSQQLQSVVTTALLNMVAPRRRAKEEGGLRKGQR